VAATAGYAVLPVLAAARIGEALLAGDAAGLDAAVDWGRLPEGLDRAMSESIAQHSGPAATFLMGMAEEIRQGLATPSGLMMLARDRLPAHQPANGLGMIGAIQPLDGMRLRVDLHASGENRQAFSITLALTDVFRMRWQVVGVNLPPLPLGGG
jgi:hypothetical protein